MPDINIRPSEFAEEFLFIEKGKPFSIAKWPFFYDIYDCQANYMVLMCSRQVGKSLTIGNFSLANIAMAEMGIDYIYNHNFSRDDLCSMDAGSFHVLYVAPTRQQIRFFSEQKLALIIDGSPIFDYFLTPKCRDQVTHKSFRNGSDIFLASCYHSPDSIRGISTNQINIDEVQDIVSDHIPVIEEAQSRSSALRKINMKSGTPKTTRNTIQYFWKRSSQNEWVVKCAHCNHWNVLGEDNIDPRFLCCNRPDCKKEIDRKNGLWVSMNPKVYTQGFRVNALMADFAPWTGEPGTQQYRDSLMYKYENYPRSKFYNEVLGLPYDSGSVPITEADMRSACDAGLRRSVNLTDCFEPGLTQPIRGKLIGAGVDWGTCQDGAAYTVLCITTFINDRFYPVFAKKYMAKEADPRHQVDDIIRWSNHYGVGMIGADWGFGHMTNRELAAGFGECWTPGKSDRVVEFMNNHGIKERRSWDNKARRYLLNRTETMVDIFTAIKNKTIVFPKWEVTQPFAEDILNIYQEYNDKTRVMQFDHSPDEPDDFMFALLYSVEVLLIQMGRNSL